MKLKDKVAIIVGGASGIGKATSYLFAREGARVIIADMDIESAQKVAVDLNSQGYSAVAVKVDMTKPADTERMAQESLDKFGRIDILANIAGGSRGRFIRDTIGPFSESTKEEWDRIIDINLTGPRNCIRAVVNPMIGRKYGKIINLSSLAGLVGGNNACDYSAAKSALIGFTKSLAIELSPLGINVNCVAPGIIGTERVRALLPEERKKLIEGSKLGRMGTPEEIANVILFLASDESSYITGETIPVTGGNDLGQA
jgi:3-oxoacyl-[acyl-carrier protein] reductase